VRVAIDGRTLQHRPRGGVGRGLANLLPYLTGGVEADVLVDRRLPTPPGLEPLGRFAVHAVTGPRLGRGAAWLQVAVPRWLQGYTGIFHCPLDALPYRQPVPMVVTIHDLAFEDHPEWFRSRAQAIVFQLQARHAARTARVVVTVSETMRSELMARYGLSSDVVVVVPNAIDPAFSPTNDTQRRAGMLRQLGVTPPYVVAIGGSPRRGASVAVEAWKLARRRGIDVRLVLVGPERPRDEGVVAVGPFDDWRWPSLLAGAEALCFPTRSESFGMPALEAAASGTPVVAAPVGALPEVMGDAAEWCESPDPAEIADGLVRLLGDGRRAAALREAGLTRAASWPTWAESATKLLSVYERAAASGPRALRRS
jgi:glycosyltransferase involved in cell wall biosynthesis